MKILLVQYIGDYLFSAGGAHKANRLLMEGFAARGHTCQVVTVANSKLGPTTHDEFLSKLRALGIQPISTSGGVIVFEHHGVEIHAITSNSLQFVLQVKQRVRTFDPTWTLVTDDYTHLLLETTIDATQGRAVYIVHSPAALPTGPQAFSPHADDKQQLKRAAGIITVSEYVKGYIEQWCGVTATVIPFPVYGAGPFPRLGRPDHGAVTIINPSDIKGISIFAALAARFPTVPFAAVPTWATTAADRATLAALPNVRLLPPADDIDQIFAHTRVLLVPSLWDEAFGLVTVEAMLRGIPVLASHVGGLPEAKLGVPYVLPVAPITHYRPAVGDRTYPVADVPPQDLTPWTAALHALLSDPTHYTAIADASAAAATAFVTQLSIAPFERFLEQLDATRATPIERVVGAPLTTPQPSIDLTQLSPEKRALLALRLKKKAPPPSTKHLMTRQPRRAETNTFPLSFAQQRLWFLDKLLPESLFFSVFVPYRVLGPLNIPALERSLNEIARRHESLRTTFAVEMPDGQPVQVIAPALKLPLPVLDLRAVPADEQEAESRRVSLEMAAQPFDLTKGPLMRTMVLQLGEQEYMLLLNMHHIISDGWSTGVLVQELGALYTAFVNDQPSPLRELLIQYADFAVWQRETLKGDVLESHLAYWRNQLAGAPPVLDLPTDRPRPAVQTFNGAREFMTIPPPLMHRLKAISLEEGTTLFMTMLAVFNILLARYSSREDIVVGMPVANRTHAELHTVIGLFVNMLVLRTDLSGNPTFEELLRRVRRVALGAYAHQDLPFERLVEELQPKRDVSHSPLFQVVFALQNAAGSPLELPQLTLQPIDLDNGTTQSDLGLHLWETDAGLKGLVEYNTDLFDRSTILRMISHYMLIVEQVAAAPEQRIGDIPLLTEAERHQMLREWSTAADMPPNPAPIAAQFMAQAQLTPQAPAVVYGNTTLTYAELDQRSNQLAHALQRLGIGPEVCVGLSVERAPEMIVGILGILKAGGAYVPLDPTYPEERLQFMLNDAQVPVLITLATLYDQLPHTGQALFLDTGWSLIAREPITAPATRTHPESLAYVIYTSGSTGQPKGVLVPQRGLSNLVSVQSAAFGIDPHSRVLQFAAISFDASVSEVFVTLLSGATLVLPPPDNVLSGADLAGILQDYAISVVTLPPSVLTTLPDIALPELKTLIVAGESCPPDLIARWGTTPDGMPRRFINAYGPTETTVCATVSTKLDAAAARPPIGKPVANVEVYVLDAAMTPVPIGVPGELYIGGSGVARGYLHQPALTAARFVPDLFAGSTQAASGSRLYQTGDLVRYREDGQLEFLGRCDQQVKVRGFRVEPGEVETALRQLPSVSESVVMTHEDRYGVCHLIAYIVSAAEPAPLTSKIRTMLQQTLPDYMIPTSLVLLDALPLTPNGKIDRQALPDPTLHLAASSAMYIPPRNDTERTIAQVWREVLGVEQVGIHDNFFDLGGHSLLIAAIHSNLEQRLKQTISMVDLLKYPTVSSLTHALTQTSQGQPALQGRLDRAASRRSSLQQKRQLRQARSEFKER